MIAPIPIQDVHTGREALKRDLGRYLKDSTLVDKGWAQPDVLTLLIPILATNPSGQCDFYLLKLVFDHYPKGPPSAQFINPLTNDYTFPKDVMWVPKIEGHPAIHFHTNYNNQLQLVCSSTTLEFYKVNHDVQEENIWREGDMSFMSTVAAIRAGLSQPYYKGRSTE